MTQKWKTNQTTSKIHKPHINEKPKRSGTHQYPHLGPKVAVVAGKLDPTVDQHCFCPIFQTVRNLQKGTTEMSSEGPKNGGKEVWVGLKSPENTKILRPKLAIAAAFADSIQASPAAASRKSLQTWLSGHTPPPCLEHVQ